MDVWYDGVIYMACFYFSIKYNFKEWQTATIRPPFDQLDKDVLYGNVKAFGLIIKMIFLQYNISYKYSRPQTNQKASTVFTLIGLTEHYVFSWHRPQQVS